MGGPDVKGDILLFRLIDRMLLYRKKDEQVNRRLS